MSEVHRNAALMQYSWRVCISFSSRSFSSEQKHSFKNIISTSRFHSCAILNAFVTSQNDVVGSVAETEKDRKRCTGNASLCIHVFQDSWFGRSSGSGLRDHFRVSSSDHRTTLERGKYIRSRTCTRSFLPFEQNIGVRLLNFAYL